MVRAMSDKHTRWRQIRWKKKKGASPLMMDFSALAVIGEVHLTRALKRAAPSPHAALAGRRSRCPPQGPQAWLRRPLPWPVCRCCVRRVYQEVYFHTIVFRYMCVPPCHALHAFDPWTLPWRADGKCSIQGRSQSSMVKLERERPRERDLRLHVRSVTCIPPAAPWAWPCHALLRTFAFDRADGLLTPGRWRAEVRADGKSSIQGRCSYRDRAYA